MDAIEAIIFAGGAGFAIVVVATIAVIIGVGQEERLGTLAGQHPPTVLALLARLVVGTQGQMQARQHKDPECPNSCEYPKRDGTAPPDGRE